jgi:hypothetical protein
MPMVRETHNNIDACILGCDEMLGDTTRRAMGPWKKFESTVV